MTLVVKNPPANAGEVRDMGSITESGISPGGGHGNPFQYSCLENPMDRGAWWAPVHRGLHRVGHYWSNLACLHVIVRNHGELGEMCKNSTIYMEKGMVAEEQTHLQVLCPVIATHMCVGVYIHTYRQTYICSIYLQYYINIQSTLDYDSEKGWKFHETTSFVFFAIFFLN